MSFIRRMIGRVVASALPARWVRVAKGPALLPGYYRDLVGEVEAVLDLQARPETLGEEYWAAQLRKYAHIIDKGLSREDVEAGHSLQFYSLALDALARLRSRSALDDPSIIWARAVLSEYEQLQSGGTPRPAESPGGKPNVTCDQLLDLMRGRRSHRSFSERAVDGDVLRTLAEAASWAPSSCNRQSVKLFTTNDPILAARCLATCKGATCFKRDSAPCFIAFCNDLRPYVLPQEMWLSVVDASLAAQNACLAAHALGLSLTFLTWCQHDKAEDRELRGLLGIPQYYQIVVNAAVGYPDRAAGAPLRKDLDSTYTLTDGLTMRESGGQHPA